MPCQAKWYWRRLILSITGIFCLFSTTARADLLVSGYQDRLHDPYYTGPDKAFIGADYNWSGVGRVQDPIGSGSNWKTLTMISDNYFITANHFQPIRADDPTGPAPKVRFYRTTDPNGEYWESEIGVTGNKYEGQRIGLTDLWVGKLANKPPDWVMRYPLAKRHEATNYLSYTDHDLFVFGQDSPRSLSSLRVGRNKIDQVEQGGNYSWDYDPKNGFGADEAQTQSGDSGSPSFLTQGRVPVLAGVHTREGYDTGVAANLVLIRDAVDEPISLSTGSSGDLNGDFRVDVTDLSIVITGFNKSANVRIGRGDITGDGRVDSTDLSILLANYGRESFAPADMDRDGDVDGDDLTTIGSNWLKNVSAPFTQGDANGDAFVDLADVEIFERNQFRAFFGPLPAPLSPVAGDLTGNGVVDGFDLSVVTTNLNKTVPVGTNGDADRNGVVDSRDVVYVSTRLGDSFGDINGDHVVGVGDFLVMASNWQKHILGGRTRGDLNGDFFVNSLDAQILFAWWGQVNGEFPGMLVPEPSSGALAVLLASFSSLGRCRRSRYFSRAILRYNS